jgi:HlyD family secretion protein
VDLAPKVAGRVVEVLVREGDRVKAGDLLVKLDLGEMAVSVERDRSALDSTRARYADLQAGSRAAEIKGAEEEVADRRAAVELARPELERQEVLLSKKVGTPRDVDVARATLERAQANLRMSEEKLKLLQEGFRKYQTEQARFEVDRAKSVLKQSEIVAKESEVRAPADGVILHRMAEPGLLLGAGQPALTLGFTNRLYVRTYVPETQMGRVKAGQPAEVTVDTFPGRRFPARVTEISPDAEFTPKPVETRRERVNLVYAAKVDLDGGWNEPLVPGQPAEVAVTAAAPAR